MQVLVNYIESVHHPFFFPSETKFLHTNKFLHRDLKTDNVLLVSLSEHSEIRGKISDFGTRFVFKVHYSFYSFKKKNDNLQSNCWK